MLAGEGRAFIADGAGGLLLVDVSDPARPRRLSSLDLAPYEARDVARRGDTLVVALGRGGLALVEEQRGKLRLVRRFSLSRPAVELAVSGTRVFVANDSGGLAALDLSPRLSAPKLLTPDPGP